MQDFSESEFSPNAEFEKIEKFKRKVIEVDGELIPLRKKLPTGEQLFVAVRNGDIQITDYSDERDDNGELREYTRSTYLVEVFSGQDGEIKPIGHWDWYGDRETARGSGNMHKYGETYPENQWQEEADKKWKNNTDSAFKVDEAYRGMGIGTFIFATSAVVLAERYPNIHTGALLKPARKILVKFGPLEKNMFQDSTAHLVNNPEINKVLQDFV